ncbi:TIGR03086 family metal-binding protein [Streptomyces sp. VRA16 Mangrove soil]|uniref:TIGR03086 family metal-binding protein n=1 Tax=Streptomyces sp. VRA16 Mangrove soil TaxID=2817434 RepID=UPI001A9DFD27|nr:TIGR03086 family metal-binding protein [Streptomyces sp. VRA16 Mangrove soil]MBO1335268.1 TIGR03086 family protein [Streptomyces sp. VRA16 Mangrove soil]
MSDTTVDLGPQARIVARLAHGVRDEQLDLPTPCPDFAVRHLLGHFLGLSEGLRATARKERDTRNEATPGSALPDLAPDWRAALPKALDALVEAWQDPAAWDGMTHAGGVDLPGSVAGLVTADELVVHGWDLARATGQEYTPDEPALWAAHALLAPAADDSGGGGLFGPVVPVPAEASFVDRVVGLSGRDPGWRP